MRSKEIKIMRKEINSIVRKYAMEHEGKFHEAWCELYKLYNKVNHQNIRSRATKRHLKPIDVIEQEDNLEILKILAENLFAA